jgi:hypothetical protein
VDRTLLELMETCKDWKSCDPHDRIYAILGSAGDVVPEASLVDYESQISRSNGRRVVLPIHAEV